MGGHHKKNVRAEKAKVKLKGAKLPKGLNVTKTEFKVRKIVIRDQLNDHVHYVDGQKQLNLKETLSRLKHHSSNFRLEALRNLREPIAGSQSIITLHLNELIQGIAAICLDNDKETRRESFKVLSNLLGSLPSDTVAPFFHVISSYLRCAMTHIQSGVQEDSLLMLDVLLKHVPRLVAANSSKIFRNFLEMISRVRSDGDKSRRILTTNMGHKQTTTKWRSKVLERLQHMLQTLVEHQRSENSETSTTSSNIAARTVTFNSKALQYFGLKRQFAAHSVCDLSAIFSQSSALTNDNSMPDESAQLRSYIEHLMPLLLESWLEVRPQQQTEKSDREILLSADASVTLKVVLEIIENLWTLVELLEKQVNNHDLSEWFRKNYSDVFSTSFLHCSYPYQQVEAEHRYQRKCRKNAKTDASSQHCLPQNITLSYLVCRFYDHSMKDQASKFATVLQYLKDVVNRLSMYDNQEHLRSLVPALRALLYDNGLELLQFHRDNARDLLRSTVAAFLDNTFAEFGSNSKVLMLLCSIVQEPALCKAYGQEEFVSFLAFLPQLLLKPTISEAALISMAQLGKQQNPLFLQALRKVVAPVLEHIQRIQVTGSINTLEGKKHIMNLFYWLETLPEEEVQPLLEQLETNVTDKRIVSYYRFVLTKV